MLAELIYAGFKFSRVGIRSRKFEPRINFSLYGTIPSLFLLCHSNSLYDQKQTETREVG